VSAVLIVDDDERLRSLLARWLGSAGYDTCQAADAETGFERLLAGGCDVAVCDVIMPGRGGLWLVQRVREQCLAVAIVLATGVEHVHPSVSLGGNVVEYLVKPFGRAEAVAAVALARASHQSAARPGGSGGDGDPLAAWLHTGRSPGPELK
jgi:two-component system, OmpR family, response regulator